MARWLFKSEPVTYSIDDLKRDRRERWDGIRNYQARNFMRNDMTVGDSIVFYHSSCKIPAAVGLAKVSRPAIADITQFDAASNYYDKTAREDAPRWWCVEVAFVKKFAAPVTLTQMREMPELADMQLLARGNRLSILPLSERHYSAIVARAEAPARR